jgi:N-methylhydantoinase B/oxoprolinase/acetone carboxylase alpha subunit
VNKFKASMFPGTYRGAAFHDIPNSRQPIRIPVDYLAMMPLEAKVSREGHVSFDWDGTSKSGYHSNNSSFCASKGNHIYTLLQDALTDGFFNQGLAYSFDLNIPKGTTLNPEIDKACSSWMTIVAGMCGALGPMLTRAFYAKGIREEGFASKPTNAGVFAGGMDHNGTVFGAYNFETNCSGCGAQSNYDGLPAGNSVWNPEVNMSDCETFEHMWPLMWLGRGVTRDGGGFGRRRGGGAVESLYVVEHNPQYFESGTTGSGANVFVSPGLFGGYPAPAQYRYTLRNTNYKEVVDKKLPLPHSEGDDSANPDFAQMLKGELVLAPAMDSSRRFQDYDIIHQHSGGGGGWGDPLNREIADIEKDIGEGVTAMWSVKNVYKVAFHPGTEKIDPVKTQEQRDQERQARLKRAIPVSQFVAAQKKRILAGDIPAITKKTFNETFRISKKFLKDFRESWGLGEDFKSI